MPRLTTIAAKLSHLQGLRDPVEQVAYALGLLTERSTRLQEAALVALERSPTEALVPAARPALRGPYERLDADGPHTDASGTRRAARRAAPTRRATRYEATTDRAP